MHLSQLLEHTCKVQPLDPKTWARATLLGDARTEANKHRKDSSDRGRTGNKTVDRVGALGELVLLGYVRRAGSAEAADKMVSHLFSPRGGSYVKGPDLIVLDTDSKAELGVDAKSFSCQPSYRYFAINAEKHEELRGACAWYFPVIAPYLGREALIGRLVPYEDVEPWVCEKLKSEGTPSCNLPIEEFFERYVPADPDEAARPVKARLTELRSKTYPADDIEELVNDPRIREEMIDKWPSIERYLPTGTITSVPA